MQTYKVTILSGPTFKLKFKVSYQVVRAGSSAIELKISPRVKMDLRFN